MLLPISYYRRIFVLKRQLFVCLLLVNSAPLRARSSSGGYKKCQQCMHKRFRMYIFTEKAVNVCTKPKWSAVITPDNAVTLMVHWRRHDNALQRSSTASRPIDWET